MNSIAPREVTRWFADASDSTIQEFLDAGLSDLIMELEEDDFFGTEGFEKRFA